jgi:hypothetical protein
VLAKHHRALLIMGSGHFLRGFPFPAGRSSFSIEQQLRQAGAKTYVIVAGTNAIGPTITSTIVSILGPHPVIVSLPDSWVGELPALPVVSGGVDISRIRFGSGTNGLGLAACGDLFE